ncbi:MAG TPA: competence/damage-inducible protein A [Vicinamibacterales bacterium]|nr:competence/damage-inducible protein A [Vicinamibacterales bacterium]
MAGVDRLSAGAVRSAEVIAVGSELLGSTRLDTNSLCIADLLSSIGIRLLAKTVVGDDRDAIVEHLSCALARADLVVLTGGLGPTDDDLTRDAVARVTGRPLEEDPAIVERIAARFARRGMRMPEVNRRQALVLRGASVLENPHGTAPGQLIEHQGRTIVLLPGPPRELRPMLTALCAGALAARAGDERIYRASLFVTGRTESHVEEAVQPIYSRWRDELPPIETTILATPGQLELHLALRSADAAAARGRLATASQQLGAALGRDVFSTDGRSMEEIVGALLHDRGVTIAAAESCTGGLLMTRLTDVPGSSAYVLGGVVSYSNDLKTGVLRVADDHIRVHGAVSEPVAVAMAEGVQALTGARLGVGITGVAGPGGGTPAKPVGTVVIAVVDRSCAATVRTYQLPGGRAQIRFQATQSALDMVRRLLIQPS